MGGRAIVNIGAQRFDKLREEGRFYIDKTEFISTYPFKVLHSDRKLQLHFHDTPFPTKYLHTV